MNSYELAEYLNSLLRVAEIQDISNNGLQVENGGREVKKVGMAVDASLKSFEEAAKRGIDFLLVHHGLFWGKPELIRGQMYNRIKALMNNGIALYAAHLPLDIHPEYGNNAVGLKLLGVEKGEPFGDYHGVLLGWEFELSEPVHRDEFKKTIDERFATNSIFWPFGPSEIKRGAFISGGAISLLPEAISKGLDIYITGEPSHTYYWQAVEGGINVVMAGHYATERLGVMALGEHINEKFDIPIEFIELPTGH